MATVLAGVREAVEVVTSMSLNPEIPDFIPAAEHLMQWVNDAELMLAVRLIAAGLAVLITAVFLYYFSKERKDRTAFNEAEGQDS